MRWPWIDSRNEMRCSGEMNSNRWEPFILHTVNVYIENAEVDSFSSCLSDWWIWNFFRACTQTHAPKKRLSTLLCTLLCLTFAIGKSDFFILSRNLYRANVCCSQPLPDRLIFTHYAYSLPVSLSLSVSQFLHNIQQFIICLVWFCFCSWFDVSGARVHTFNALASNPASSHTLATCYMDNANANKDICFL